MQIKAQNYVLKGISYLKNLTLRLSCNRFKKIFNHHFSTVDKKFQLLQKQARCKMNTILGH